MKTEIFIEIIELIEILLEICQQFNHTTIYVYRLNSESISKMQGLNYITSN